MLTAIARTWSQVRPVQPRTVLVLLLAACALKGALFVRGLPVPTDLDTVRDIGFIQGAVDGTWFGDPAVDGAWRWYPPLIHWLAGAAAWATGADVLAVWPRVGAVLNLATPAAFFWMNRALFGAWPAAVATAVMVLFNGGVMAGDEAAGYTPWTLTPALTWPLFFLGVGAIHRYAPALRFPAALGLGCLLGIIFLAHTVPAVLLSGIVTAVVLATSGLTVRGLAWLALAGGVELLFAVPFLGPLALEYRLHIANPVPGAWVHAVLSPTEGLWRLLVLNLPGVLAGLSVWVMRHHVRLAPGVRGLPPATAAVFAAWIGLCLVFLARHFACHGLPQPGGACTAFVIAAHHFHVYLQAAWASLVGLSLWIAMDPGQGRDQARHGAFLAGGVVLVVLGTACFLTNPHDRNARATALADPDAVLDRAAHAWIIGHATRHDRFVTLLPDALDQMGPAAATVIAAGRPLVAPPRIHTNPYLDWEPLDAARLAWLSAATGQGKLPCQPWGVATYAMLPASMAVAPARMTEVFRSPRHAIHRFAAPVCPPPAADPPPGGSGEGGKHLLDRLHLVSRGG